MSWAFKYVGNAQGLAKAMDEGGGQYNSVSGRLEVPDSYTRAVREIINHISLHPDPSHPQCAQIGWQVEAWGGEASFHIDVQPVNLRIAASKP